VRTQTGGAKGDKNGRARAHLMPATAPAGMTLPVAA
jgi:hypothetical protein